MRNCGWLSLLVLGLACGDDSGDSGASSSSSSEASSSTAADSTSTTAPSTTAPATTTSTGPTGPTCGDTTDCKSCYECASMGPCKPEFDACAGSIECAGTVFCFPSMCPDDITPGCVDTCCMNCLEHNTCSIVDTYLACMSEQCPGLCGEPACL